MHLSDFQYELPAELIAQAPLAERSASRLLCLDGASGALADRRFTDLPALLRPADLLVFNDTRVIPARLFGHKETGGQVEILIERVLDAGRCLAQVRASKPPRAGMRIELEGGAALVVQGREGDFFTLMTADGAGLLELLERQGHMPLPPYIDRADVSEDRTRYQTVYARAPGAVAAPTAGLHFDAPLLARIAEMGVASAYVTLHVAAGTFQPVRCENIAEHRMHSEYVEVSEAVVAAVAAARARGGRVIAVGTTALRSLESAARSGVLQALQGDTDLFIYPGYRFKCVDALITNFHLPGSSLLMLVSAFAGYDHIMAAYRHAVAARYRFFSYGDAMFLTPTADARSVVAA